MAASTATTLPRPSSRGLNNAFKSAASASASAAAQPPAPNQLDEDQPLTSVFPKPQASSHYFQWGMSIKESKIDTGLQTEVHLYMKRPPSAPVHISNLASSLIATPIVRAVNTTSRQWVPTLNAYQVIPSDCVEMDVDQ